MLLYVIAEGEFGPCKIGFADRMGHRLSNLQAGNHRELTVFYEQETPPNYRMAERIAHSRAGYKNRIRGEWFNVTVVAAISAVKQACYLAQRTHERVAGAS